MPTNQMTKNKGRPHSCATAQLGRGIIRESALPLRKFDPPLCSRKTQLVVLGHRGRCQR